MMGSREGMVTWINVCGEKMGLGSILEKICGYFDQITPGEDGEVVAGVR